MHVLRYLWDLAVGNVGIPLPCVEIKLIDLPELGYTAEDKPWPRGEVCFRGPCCCKGQYWLLVFLKTCQNFHCD